MEKRVCKKCREELDVMGELPYQYPEGVDKYEVLMCQNDECKRKGILVMDWSIS